MVLLLWLLAEWLGRSQPTTSLCALEFSLCACLPWEEQGAVYGGCAAVPLTASKSTSISSFASLMASAFRLAGKLYFCLLCCISVCCAVQHSMVCRIVHHPSLYYNIPCCVQAPKMSSALPSPNWDVLEYWCEHFALFCTNAHTMHALKSTSWDFSDHHCTLKAAILY